MRTGDDLDDWPSRKPKSVLVHGDTTTLGAALAAYYNKIPTNHAEASLRTGNKPDIRIAHCPERVLPGKIIREQIENDRVVGGVTPHCSLPTAGLCKLVDNAFRDVNIAFANEISKVSERHEVDVVDLINLAETGLNQAARIIVEPVARTAFGLALAQADDAQIVIDPVGLMRSASAYRVRGAAK